MNGHNIKRWWRFLTGGHSARCSCGEFEILEQPHSAIVSLAVAAHRNEVRGE
jgi:hypothetical protein